jgi:hypothetical protein
MTADIAAISDANLKLAAAKSTLAAATSSLQTAYNAAVSKAK